MQNRYEYTDGLNRPMEAFYHKICPGNFPILPHWHYFIEIIHIIEGKIEATCDHSVYTLSPGDLLIFCPQKIHSINVLYDDTIPNGINLSKTAEQTRLYIAKPQINLQHNAIYPVPTEAFDLKREKEDLCYRVLKFDLNFLNTNHQFHAQFSKALLHVFEQNPENIYFSADMLKDFPIKKLIDSCIQEMNAQDYGYDHIASSLATTLLTDLMRIWLRRGLNLNEIIRESTSSNRAFDDITGYIEKHYNESLRVQALADHCNMSYSYFAKLFRKTYNQSCKEYIEFVRVSKVQDLLRFTNLDLTYISQETGFADCSHLIRTFKKHTGVTPKQWRSKHGYSY